MSDTSPLPFSLLPNVLHASPEFASTIVDALADALVVYDAAGRIMAGNTAAATLLGLTLSGRGAALAVPIGERASAAHLRTLEGRPLPNEERPAVRVLRGETLSGTETVDVIARTADGQQRILNVSGVPLVDADGHALTGQSVSVETSLTATTWSENWPSALPSWRAPLPLRSRPSSLPIPPAALSG